MLVQHDLCIHTKDQHDAVILIIVQGTTILTSLQNVHFNVALAHALSTDYTQKR